jgi:ketosteroid isomerase-like protein
MGEVIVVHKKLISKLLLVAVAMLFAPSFVAQGQGVQGSAGRNRKTEQKLRALDRQWGQALVQRDVPTLERLLSDDYTLLDPSGQIINKAQQIREVKSPVFAFAIKSYKTKDVSISITGRRATLRGHAVLEFTLDKQDFTRHYWFTHTFVKRWGRWGRWRIIAAQMIELPKDGDDGKKGTYPQKVAAMMGMCSRAARNSHSNEFAPVSSDGG